MITSERWKPASSLNALLFLGCVMYCCTRAPVAVFVGDTSLVRIQGFYRKRSVKLVSTFVVIQKAKLDYVHVEKFSSLQNL